MVDLFSTGIRLEFPAMIVAVEVATSVGSIVCCDAHQWATTMEVCKPGDKSGNVAAEVVLLVAGALPGNAPAGTLEPVKKLYRKDVAFLLSGSLPVVSRKSGESLGRIPFDKNRLPTVTELEEVVQGVSRDLATCAFTIGWRVVGPGARDGAVLVIDGDADVKALGADVKAFGVDGVELCVEVASIGGPAGQSQQNDSSAALPSAAKANKATPSSQSTSASPQSRKSAPRGPASASNSTATAKGSPRRGNKSAAPSRLDDASQPPEEDNDIDYVAISYELNPPQITVVGFLGEPGLAALCSGILGDCVTGARVAMMRTAPPKFEKTSVIGGGFPVYVLNLSRSYFDEAQEMKLTCCILDTMEQMGVFRVVPMDGSVTAVTSMTQQSRERSRMMMSMNAARVASATPRPIDTNGAKRSAQFFFIPR